MNNDLNASIKQKILQAQRNEITEHVIYKQLASFVKIKEHSDILNKISQDELSHYNFFKAFTGEDIHPDTGKIFIFVSIAKIFGLNFGLKLLENGEGLAQDAYDRIKQISPEVQGIIEEEEKHEHQLITLINEERLKYISSIVLGLNDALVELSGALVGFTLALQNTRLVGIVGLITGIAGALSMAASEYLSTKHEETDKNPLKACIYTGITYIATVVLLVAPYFIFKQIFFCLFLVLVSVLSLILIFTYYISVAKGLNFKKRFAEMAGISLTIAVINYLIGITIRKVFGIDI